MNTGTQHNIGAFIAIATLIAPQAATATVNGTSLDRAAHNMPLSCLLHQVVGAAAGSPTSFTAQTKLQHSPDNATWTDYVAPGASSVAQTTAAAAAGDASAAIDLSSAQRFVRAVSLITFTGGSSPSVLVAADLVIGGEQLNPAV